MKKSILFICLIISSTFAFAQEKVKFQANIANRNGDLLYIKDKMNKTIHEMKSDKNGQFSASFETKPDFYILYDGVEYTDVYLKNGFDLKLVMDAKNFDKSIVWSGTGAEENNYLAKSIVLSYAEEEKMAKLDETNYTKYIEEKRNDELERLKSSKVCAEFVELQKSKTEEELKGVVGFFESKLVLKKLDNIASPTFDFENYRGGKTKLEDLRGKYVYVDVWATWCGPCRAEIPSLKKVEEKFHGKNIEFVSISVDEPKDDNKWKTFVKEKSLGGIQLFADKEWNSEFIKAFGINAIPRFILIDPKGNVVSADELRPSDIKLTEKLEQLLK